MVNDTELTEEEARARFGELLDPVAGTYKVFDELNAGAWRPELHATTSGMVLRCYKLYPPIIAQGVPLP